MEVSAVAPAHLPKPPEKPDVEKIKQKLLQSGVVPTPKIIHNIRKKQLQKLNRRIAKKAAKEPPPLTDAEKQTQAEELHFQAVKSEYKRFKRTITAKNSGKLQLTGRPWERLEKLQLQEFSSDNNQYFGDKLKDEPLRELSDIIESERDKFRWLLDADVEIEEGWFGNNQSSNWVPPKRRGGEAEAIRFLINKLSGTQISLKNYKFPRMMKHSGLQFTERQMLRLVEGLGERGQWRHALSVVEWVYNLKEYKIFKSRFVYTKLVAVLGKSRRPHEALQVFNLMRGDAQIYPDMAAYHSVAVALGQGGLLKELIKIIDFMKEKPKKIKNMRRKNWDPVLLPDIVIYNAVLNACVPSRQWRGVFWVFQQLRKNNVKPTGATYGLAMEVMLQSGKYDLVHEFFEKMKRSGNAVKAITYKVLVKAFWEEGKVNEAIQAVREMEQRGIVGIACVYYELACCLCYHGNLEGAFLEIEKLRSLRRIRPLAITFTGMILSSMDGGHIDNCISIYEHSKNYCEPDIGIINAMLKVYGRNDMFLEAKELYELTKKVDADSQISLSPDIYTFSSMLEASACALQWEYFENVYKEMSLAGYQLDQKKHAYLLVDASKAGKGHLLDHAFDTILEAGEVPHRSFFTEILCNAISRHAYERVVTIINMLAIAPFQINEQEWIELFEDNRDRITNADLQELLETLPKQGLRTEPTISNLYRALQTRCGIHDSSHINSTGGSDLKPTISSKTATLNSSEKSQLSISETIGREDEDSENDDELDSVPDSSRSNHCGDESAFPSTILEHFDEDSENEDSDDCFDEFDEFYVEVPGSDDEENSHVTKGPSAYEILQSWKEMKKKDDIFPLQISH